MVQIHHQTRFTTQGNFNLPQCRSSISRSKGIWNKIPLFIKKTFTKKRSLKSVWKNFSWMTKHNTYEKYVMSHMQIFLTYGKYLLSGTHNLLIWITLVCTYHFMWIYFKEGLCYAYIRRKNINAKTISFFSNKNVFYMFQSGLRKTNLYDFFSIHLLFSFIHLIADFLTLNI